MKIIHANQASSLGLSENEVRQGISEVFAEGFAQWLTYFSKDKTKISEAFAPTFQLDTFYIAVSDKKIAGIVACTNTKDLALNLDNAAFRKQFGLIKGTIANIVLKKEFGQAFDVRLKDTGSIEFVGTHPDFRGQGVATQLLHFIMENTSYTTFLIEEVADTNTPAMNLYTKLGFKEYRQKDVPPKSAKKIGINRFYSLKFDEQN
ncbi:GNAT family N-acetyltransferase [Enterococcus casseliflavus]|nr:GNAT family N-acetyltransferase [Enterococcus casseliflavus]